MLIWVKTAKAVDDTYSGLTGAIFANDSDDEDISNSYDDAVVEALRTLKDGEVYGELVETDTNVYILRMDKVNDEDATASKKEHWRTQSVAAITMIPRRAGWMMQTLL